MNMKEKIAERLMQHYAEGGPWDGFMEAEIVLDTLMDATPEMIRALKPDMDYEEVYTAMIRAAKEGK